MRYTRYEYKKSGSLKFLIAVVTVALLSVGGGLYISNVLFGTNNNVQNADSTTDSSAKSNVDIQPGSVIALQCGFYSKKENADALTASIKQYCYPFISEENGNYRVIAGIYNEDEAEKKIQQLEGNGIEVAKTTLPLKADTSDDKKIIEISDGLLKIMSKFDEADVTSIKTGEFKNWCNSVAGNEGQYGEKLKKIMSYVQNLPDEIDKNNNSEEAYEFYKLIKE